MDVCRFSSRTFSYSAFVRVPVRKFCMHELLTFVYKDDSIDVGRLEMIYFRRVFWVPAYY